MNNWIERFDDLDMIRTTTNEGIFVEHKREDLIDFIRDEREHVKQTILIKLLPYLTDEQREKLVEILKEV